MPPLRPLACHLRWAALCYAALRNCLWCRHCTRSHASSGVPSCDANTARGKRAGLQRSLQMTGMAHQLHGLTKCQTKASTCPLAAPALQVVQEPR